MSASKLGKCASAGLRPVTPRRPSVHSTPLRSSCNPLLTVPRFQPSSCSARYGIPSKISSTVRAMNSRRAYPVSEPAVSRASFLTASKLNIIVKDHAQLPRVKFSAHLVFGESLMDPEQGKVAPYGVYDLKQNEAWVSVGISHDTAEFAVETIRTWWKEMGAPRYPQAKSVLITADCGGSNGYRVRLWKLELQGLVDEIGIPVTICHLPPGTSKWNKVEHRLFSFISQNWRGKPLVTHQVIVNLIA